MNALSYLHQFLDSRIIIAVIALAVLVWVGKRVRRWTALRMSTAVGNDLYFARHFPRQFWDATFGASFRLAPFKLCVASLYEARFEARKSIEATRKMSQPIVVTLPHRSVDTRHCGACRQVSTMLTTTQAFSFSRTNGQATTWIFGRGSLDRARAGLCMLPRTTSGLR